MNRLERIAKCYWAVGTALRHPDAPAVSTEKALKALNTSDQLRPQDAKEMRLSAEMHTLRYDIIEGNTEWRSNESRKVINSTLIQFTKN